MTSHTDDARWLRRVLQNETVGGTVMLAAAAAGLVCANSGLSHWYSSLTGRHLAISALHLDLSLAQWAADFLLALFFLLAGAELKHELTSGSLATARTAVVPVVSAVGGMAASIGVFAATCAALGGSDAMRTGWAVPSSTDIAFALAVLAIGGRGLHPSVRVLLLSVAVVNDVGSIVIIAIGFAAGFDGISFVLALACVAVWALLQRRGVRLGLAYLPVFLAGWYFMHESGVHATIAGMAFGLATSTAARGNRGTGVQQVERALRPWVAGLAVPAFAFLSAGVRVVDADMGALLSSPLVVGIAAGLVIGQPVGVSIGSWAARRFLNGETAAGPRELRVVAALAGVGFTVALLVSELTFVSTPELLDRAKVGILIASVLAAFVATFTMRAARR